MSAGPIRLSRARALLAAAGFAVAAVVVAGCASTVSGSGAFAGGSPTDDPTTRSSTSSSRSQDFPTPTNSRTTSSSRSSSSTSSSTTSTTGSSSSTRSSTPTTPSPTPSTSAPNAALKQQLAQTATSWMHAYAAGDVPTFCSLSDPPSLQAVLDEKGITSCSTLTITWDTDRELQAKLAAFAIPDPSDIIVIGANAFILSFDVSPSGLVGVNWIQQADGAWKVDASILSS